MKGKREMVRCVLLWLLVFLSSVALTHATTMTYSYTGNNQNYTVPVSGTVVVLFVTPAAYCHLPQFEQQSWSTNVASNHSAPSLQSCSKSRTKKDATICLPRFDMNPV